MRPNEGPSASPMCNGRSNTALHVSAAPTSYVPFQVRACFCRTRTVQLSIRMLVGQCNFAARVKALHASGRALPADAVASLGIIEYAESGETFEALSALQLAKGARAVGVALPFTSHPSALVRCNASPRFPSQCVTTSFTAA